MDWGAIAAVLGALGFGGAGATVVKAIVDSRSGKTDRQIREIRGVIQATAESAHWAGWGFAYQTWCRAHHPTDRDGEPAPPADLLTEDQEQA